MYLPSFVSLAKLHKTKRTADVIFNLHRCRYPLSDDDWFPTTAGPNQFSSRSSPQRRAMYTQGWVSRHSISRTPQSISQSSLSLSLWEWLYSTDLRVAGLNDKLTKTDATSREGFSRRLVSGARPTGRLGGRGGTAKANIRLSPPCYSSSPVVAFLCNGAASRWNCRAGEL